MSVLRTPGSGFRSAARRLSLSMLALAALAGCRAHEPGSHVAGWVLVDSAQRHPILVSQQPSTMNIRVSSGAAGLSPGQAAQLSDFLARYRNRDSGNSKLVIAVPTGSPNEGASMRAAKSSTTLDSPRAISPCSLTTARAMHRRRSVSLICDTLPRGPNAGIGRRIWERTTAISLIPTWVALRSTTLRPRFPIPQICWGRARWHRLTVSVAST
jgi:hypothetical protein